MKNVIIWLNLIYVYWLTFVAKRRCSGTTGFRGWQLWVQISSEATDTFTIHIVYLTKYFTELWFKCMTLDLSHWPNCILSKHDSQFKSRHRWCARISIINIQDGRKFRKNIYKNLPSYHIKTMCSLAINKVK